MASAPWDYIAKLVCIGDSGCGKSSLTIRLCEGRFASHHDVTIGVEFGSRIVPVGPPHSTTGSASSPPLRSLDGRGDGDDADDTRKEGGSGKPGKGLPPPPLAHQQDKAKPPPQKHMKLSLWDTAGQETYKSVTRSYFRGASGALLVFDLTRKSTFQHATDWLNDLRQIAEPDIVVVLVGNKSDLASPNTTETPPPPTTTDTTGTKPAAADEPGTNKREVTRQEAEDWARRNGVLEYVETSAKSGENVEMAFLRVAERIFQNIQAGRYDLNDRRSGVKGHNAAVGMGGANRPVRLTGDEGKNAGGGCC
ncbi:P-loop containing nucleoside triphosphate hydrolase protein [Staphylotrichum tortipilum]|uniref:P-loop containing nucleoside triphosphate hydrolase protein n=1 Tax=Staphylotrichum tortipilum TaxID=2831512 RepID=A0AAN6MSZ8_9PEZI|nr:P-loop containing nucleoside triphosphate hydrolase protein [Staphylotrichum longicolle]